MINPDPRGFYNETMPQKTGGEYEHARWHANQILDAQYKMMVDALRRSVTRNVRGARNVLEVGPGPGTWTKLLLVKNDTAAYTLVDISHEMLAKAKNNLTDYANITFIESDFLAYEASRPHDFFFSSRAIEYMPDKMKVCGKIASLLLPGSFGALVTKMPKPLFDKVRGRAVSSLHSAQIGPAALTRLLRENGFQIERVRIATATVPLFGSVWLNKIAYHCLKHLPLFSPLSLFAESYVVTFRKIS